MAELSILNGLLGIAQKVLGLRSAFTAARQERKKQVASFLSGLAQTIEEASAILKTGEYPHGKCQELHSHSQHMAAAIGDLVGENEAEKLAAELEEVSEVESLYHDVKEKPEIERERSLSNMDRAAGMFRATAAFIRVSP